MLNHTAHRDSRHNARTDVGTFECVTHGQRIHDRGQHPHMVTSHTIHTGLAERGAAKQVTAANHDTHLHANTHQLTDFQRQAVKYLGVNTKIVLAHQRFARKLEQNTFVF